MTQPRVPTRRKRLATVGGFAAILLWSLTVAFTRRLSEQLGPVTGATCAFAVAAILGVISMFYSGERRLKIIRLPYAYLFGCGFLFVCYMLLLFLAVGLADGRDQTLEVGLINYLWPALTLLFSVVILGNRAKWFLLPGTFLALSGIFLVLTSGSSVTRHAFVGNIASNPMAYLLALAAAIFWGLYSALTRKWAGGRGDGAVALFLTATAIVLLLINLFVKEPREWSVRSIIEAVVLGFATFFAYSLWDNSMRVGNIVLVAAGSYLTPFFSTVVSCIYLSVIPSSQLWIGCGILIAGSMISWFSVYENESGKISPSPLKKIKRQL
ncbi:aromatic amino acid DMT transporter YddG [Thermodesulfobacteriota bacterium]